LYAQNWLKIKTSYLFLNFYLAKGGALAPLALPGCALVGLSPSICHYSVLLVFAVHKLICFLCPKTRNSTSS